MDDTDETPVGEIREMIVEGDRAVDRKSGISMRLVKQWDITPDPNPTHVDGYMGADGRIHWVQVKRITG